MGERRTVDSLAEALRDSPPSPDDVQRARMERELLDAVRHPRARSSRPSRMRRPFATGIAVGVVVAVAAIAMLTLWPSHDVPASGTPVAQVDALRDGLPVRSETLQEGAEVHTTDRQLLRIRFGESAEGEATRYVEVAASTRAVLESIEGPDQRVRLVRGQVRVEFHPRVRGREGFSVETEDAQVEVVGTVFDVRADERGTRVRVEEGVVRVTPHDGVARLVRAGESTSVARRSETEAVDVEASLAVPGPEVGAVAVVPELELPRRQPQVSDLHPTREVEPLDEGEPLVAIDESPPEPGEASEPLTDDLRFELASNLFDRGRLADARHELYAIARTSTARATRARAWIMVAETFERESDVGRAAEAYRRAASSGRGTHHAPDALFALARVRSAMGDQTSAQAAYERYLEVAPEGPLAAVARRELCRLGARAQCRE